MSIFSARRLWMQPLKSLENFWAKLKSLLARLVPKPVKMYWSAYGGTRELVRSPYLAAAFAFTLATFPAWLELDKDGSRSWAQLPLSVIPNILGFSMGGMAIMLAFAGSRVFIHMTEDGKDHSYFMKIIASFYHFIFAQTISLFFGLFCRTYSWWIFSFFGYASMCYAILVALATAAQIFNTARIANLAASIPEPTSPHQSSAQDRDQGPEES